jgi:uncharacterized protein (DUF433 family)
METASYPHIELRQGVPYLKGTQIKALEVALDRLAHHWDSDEIQRAHPHLSLGQIYSCLAYYCDHQEEMDRTIEEQLREVARLRAEQVESPVRLKLKALGILP